MNASEKWFSKYGAAEQESSIGIRSKGAVWVLAAAVCCVPVRGAQIHSAAELGNFEAVKTHLARDTNQINSTDEKGRTVLNCALQSGKKDIVQFLLEKGATETIYAAAAAGHAEKVAGFLRQDPEQLNTLDINGKAPLHWAALYGQTNVTQLLIAQKANLNLVDESGFTALHWAAMFGKSAVAELLLTNKANFKIKAAKFGWTPLRLAVLHGHVAAAEALLNAGADPNAKDEEDIPLLHQAVIRGKRQMIELLLARKADVNAKDSDGDTPLDEALEGGNKGIIELIIKYGGKKS